MFFKFLKFFAITIVVFMLIGGIAWYFSNSDEIVRYDGEQIVEIREGNRAHNSGIAIGASNIWRAKYDGMDKEDMTAALTISIADEDIHFIESVYKGKTFEVGTYMFRVVEISDNSVFVALSKK